MDEFVYRFLLDSGYPRAAILTDLGLLSKEGARSDAAATGASVRPDFAIVDPDTLDRLAVLLAVPALGDQDLARAAHDLGSYAQRLGGRTVQGFLIRIDPEAGTIDERVRFFRVWPSRALEPIPADAFPDLAALRTWLRLTLRAGAPFVSPIIFDLDEEAIEPAGPRSMRIEDEDDDEDWDENRDENRDEGRAPGGRVRPGLGVWLPGLALGALAIADRAVLPEQIGLLDAEQALLAVGAALSLLWAMVVRR